MEQPEVAKDDFSQYISRLSVSYVRRIKSTDYIAELEDLRKKFKFEYKLDVIPNFEAFDKIYKPELLEHGTFSLHEFELTYENKSWKLDKKNPQDFQRFPQSAEISQDGIRICGENRRCGRRSGDSGRADKFDHQTSPNFPFKQENQHASPIPRNLLC